MYRLVLFDIDGTLIRTGGAGVRAFERVAAEVLGRPGASARLRFAGRTDTSLVRELLEAEGLPAGPAHVSAFLGSYLEFLAEELGRSSGERCPAVGTAIDDLRSGPQPPLLALLTGNVRTGARLKLEAHGLWEEFLFGAFGDDHPDRNRLAELACERAAGWLDGVPAGDQVLVVGDTPLDVACARAIGADSLAVATGQHSVEDLRDAGATLSVADLSAVRWSALSQGRRLEGAV